MYSSPSFGNNNVLEYIYSQADCWLTSAGHQGARRAPPHSAQPHQQLRLKPFGPVGRRPAVTPPQSHLAKNVEAPPSAVSGSGRSSSALGAMQWKGTTEEASPDRRPVASKSVPWIQLIYHLQPRWTRTCATVKLIVCLSLDMTLEYGGT